MVFGRSINIQLLFSLLIKSGNDLIRKLMVYQSFMVQGSQHSLLDLGTIIIL